MGLKVAALLLAGLLAGARGSLLGVAQQVLGASRVSDALAAAPEGDEQWVDCSFEPSSCDLSAAPGRAWVKYAARASVQNKGDSFEVYQVAQGSAACKN